MKNLKSLYGMLALIFCAMSTVNAQLPTKDLTKETLFAEPALKIEGTIVALATCMDSEDGQIAVKARGGHLPYQYFEIEGLEKIERTQASGIFIKLDPATYTLKVVDAMGQEATTEISLASINPEPYANFELVKEDQKVKLLNTSENGGRWAWNIGGVRTYEDSPTLRVEDDLKEICLEARNGCNAADVFCETANIRQILNLSAETPFISTSTNKTNIIKAKAYPNPAIDELTVSYPATNTLTNIELYNASGMLVQTVYPQSTTQTTFSLANVPAGMYVVKMQSIQGTETLRVNKVGR